MKRSFLFLFIAALSTSLLPAEHKTPAGQDYFFLPPRSIFHFRPDLYFPPLFHLPAPVYCPPRYTSRYVFPTPGHRVFPRSQGIYRLFLQTGSAAEVVQANTSDLIFSVVPSRALVYIDGKLIGSARDFATSRDRYNVMEGTHELRIEFPGYKSFEAVMEIVPNRTLHLDIELEPEP